MKNTKLKLTHFKQNDKIKIIGISISLIIFLSFCFKNPNKTHKKGIKNALYDTISNDNKILYKNILGNNQITSYTGIRKLDNNTFVNALLVQSIDSISIKYRVESLINWKSKKNINGIAYLDNLSLGSNKWTIKDVKNNLKPAFRFIDNKKKPNIEILICKEPSFERATAVVNRLYKKQSKQITVNMRHK